MPLSGLVLHGTIYKALHFVVRSIGTMEVITLLNMVNICDISSNIIKFGYEMVQHGLTRQLKVIFLASSRRPSTETPKLHEEKPQQGVPKMFPLDHKDDAILPRLQLE